MGIEIEALLERLSEVVDTMGKMTAGKNAAGREGINGSPVVPTMQHTCQRHSEILSDFRTEFFRTKNMLRVTRDRSELLGAGPGGSGGPNARRMTSVLGASGGADALHTERAALVGASAGADAALEKGMTLRDELERQRQNFSNIMGRMEEASGKFPMLNKLIMQIKRKKKRDMYLLVALISVLTFITLTFKLL